MSRSHPNRNKLSNSISMRFLSRSEPAGKLLCRTLNLHPRIKFPMNCKSCDFYHRSEFQRRLKPGNIYLLLLTKKVNHSQDLAHAACFILNFPFLLSGDQFSYRQLVKSLTCPGQKTLQVGGEPGRCHATGSRSCHDHIFGV